MSIIHGDCLEELKKLEDCSVDAIVTDPPYGLSNTKPAQVADVLKAWVTGDIEAVPTTKGGFMGKDWDSFVPPPAVWKECMRVLKPGGHMAVFAGARTQDLMGLSIRLAGFDIRDGLSWIYGSGFPKGQDVGKSTGSRQWDGWNTQLKPSQEPIILARKPLVGTVAANVLAHGVGGLNIDACRVPSDEVTGWGGRGHASGGASLNLSETGSSDGQPNPVQGRFPANVLLDEHAAKEMDKQSGVLKSGALMTHHVFNESENASMSGKNYKRSPRHNQPANEGGASRFFPVFKYQAKAPKRERPVVERGDGTKIQHPTVKPEKLMEWLVTLIAPPGGVVLDPFAGSGTTLQAAINKGFTPIGIEQDADYIKLIEKRLEVAE